MLAKQAFLQLAEALDKDLQNGIEETVRQYFLPSKMKEVEPAQNYVRLLQSMGIRSYVTTNYDTVPVSYTHLDVYKRQAIRAASITGAP